MENTPRPIDKYINNRLKHGFSENQIINEMVQHGWDKEQAGEIIKKFLNKKQGVPQKKSLPMDIGVLVALVLLVFIIIYGFFALTGLVKEALDTIQTQQI